MGISLGVMAVIDRPDTDAPRVGNASWLGCDEAVKRGRGKLCVGAMGLFGVRVCGAGTRASSSMDHSTPFASAIAGSEEYVEISALEKSTGSWAGVRVRDTVCLCGKRAETEN